MPALPISEMGRLERELHPTPRPFVACRRHIARQKRTPWIELRLEDLLPPSLRLDPVHNAPTPH